MHLRYGSPFWLDRPVSRGGRRHAPLRGELDVDVAIVGGGFTGCLIALTFAEAGIRVAVLERSIVASGSSAASTALLMQEPDRPFSDLTDRYGISIARTVWRQSRQAVRDLTLRLRDLDCGLHTPTSLHLTLDPQRARELARDLKARRRAGLGGRYLDARALRRHTGIDGAGANRTAGNAVVDPYRVTLALAREAARAGAQLFEHSEVTRITPSAEGVTLSTPRGLIHAQRVIVATGFATPAFKRLRARFTMSTTYVIATAPVAARLRQQMGGGDLMFWDAERPYHYFRWTDDRRILFGGEDRPVPRGRRARQSALVKASKALHDKLVEIYPAASALTVARAWEGIFATTPDGLPYIGAHRDYPRHLFALGYGGNGMTFGVMAARILLRHYLDRRRPEDAIYSFARLRR
jgi:glycine/D-amino acid oxidase-like deaminating enzyme